MGRHALNLVRMNLYLDPADMKRIGALVEEKGISKFVRDTLRKELDYVAPGAEKAGPPFFERDGGHEPRLSVSGRATVFAILRKKKASLDELQRAFGFDDPIDFIHALLGHRPLPNQAAGAVVAQLLGNLWKGE